MSAVPLPRVIEKDYCLVRRDDCERIPLASDSIEAVPPCALSWLTEKRDSAPLPLTCPLRVW